jgi:hypothetical protein
MGLWKAKVGWKKEGGKDLHRLGGRPAAMDTLKVGIARKIFALITKHF